MFSKQGYLGSSIAAWSHRGRSKGGLLRLLTMYLIMIFRTIHAVVFIVRSAVDSRTTSLIVGCIFGFLATLFVPLALASLGSAEGRRRVLGINWGRLHFDVLLGFFALLCLGFMIGAFIVSGNAGNSGLFTAWCLTWTLIALFSIISGRPGVSNAYA